MRYLVIALIICLLIINSLFGVAQGMEPDIRITASNAEQIIQLASYGHGQAIKTKWSPDNRFLAVSGVRGLWLYDAQNLDAAPALLSAYGEWVYQFDFSPDSTTLATAGGDGRLRIWTIGSSPYDITEQATITAHEKPVAKVVFSPDGQRIATTDGDEVHVWPVSNIAQAEPQILTTSPYEPTGMLTFGLKTVQNIVFTPDNTAVAVAIMGQGIVFWNPDTMQENWFVTTDEVVEKYRLAGSPIGLTFDPTGQQAAISTFGGYIILADVATGDFVDTFATNGKFQDLVFSRDGSQLIFAWASAFIGAGYAAKVWDISAGEEIASLEHNTTIQSLAASPDGTILVTIENLNVRIWENHQSTYVERPSRYDHCGPLWTLAFNPDDTQVIAGCRDNTARLYDVKSGRLLHTLSGHTGPVLDVAYSSDGTYLATASNDRTIRLWSTENYASFAVLEGHGDDVYTIAVSPTGEELASGAWDSSLRIWDIATRKTAQTLWRLEQTEEAIFPPLITAVVYSPDGRWLAAGAADFYDMASDHDVIVWDARTKNQVARSSFRGGITGLAISPDSSTLAVTTAETDETIDFFSTLTTAFSEAEPIEITSTVRLWDVETHEIQELGQVIIMDTSLSRPAFSPDGSVIAMIEGQKIHIWDTATGNELTLLEVDTRPFTDLAFNASGTILASTGEDGAIRLWGIPSN